MPTIHIINHTHWDREWFLTSVYTTHWVPRLIDRLAQLAAANPDFRYLFDGQTLAVEDVLAAYPHYRPKLNQLLRGGNLTIGPYYCQPDWQLTTGESLIRNLEHGLADVAVLGGQTTVGWLVDTFGHIAQAPQIHRLFGLDSVYVWRGAPRLLPYFQWVGADGAAVLGINLFGGYRNLYGVTHAPEVALRRLQVEIDKLTPYYPTADIPLFDGYDLEDNPEDPVSFYATLPPLADTTLVESTPERFVAAIRPKIPPPPSIHGELNSGKYGATFPGTFSTRTYLKVMARDCAHALFQLAEPLAALARWQGAPYPQAAFDRLSRRLLQNAVHDCICGVSIDLVHAKMEDLFQHMFKEMHRLNAAAAAAIMADFAPGVYALSTNPFPTRGHQVIGDQVYDVQTQGLGVWPVRRQAVLRTGTGASAPLTWSRGAYPEVGVASDGVVRLGAVRLGRLVVSAEHGDTYSDEAGDVIGVMRPTSAPTLVEQSAQHALVHFTCAFEQAGIAVTADVRLTLDNSPLLRWQIDLDSRGVDFRVDWVAETGVAGLIYAGMPFDVAARSAVDSDLLPRQLEGDLANILLGQRELNRVSTFPFHDYVAVTDGAHSVVVFAKGVHTYQADDAGRLGVTLRRSVEWLTRADLRDRVGDAGPFFYVPEARCERVVRHELAAATGAFAPDSLEAQRLNAAFQNPPLLVEVAGDGRRTSLSLPAPALPLSALRIQNGALVARLYNPTPQSHALGRRYTQVDAFGAVVGEVETIRPKHILNLQLPAPLPPETRPTTAAVALLNAPPWRVGANQSRPDPAVLAGLEEKIAALTAQLAALAAQPAPESEAERLRQQHQGYVLQREITEYRLSLALNMRQQAQAGRPSAEYLYAVDPEIAALGLELNRWRIKRRIFDYVVAALPNS